MAVSDSHEGASNPCVLPTNSSDRRQNHDGEPYIYTSIRFDPILNQSPENSAASFNIPCPFYMLEHHWTRLQVARWTAQFWTRGDPAKVHDRPADFLHSLLSAVKQWQQAQPKEAEKMESLRVRRLVYPSGGTKTQIWQIPRVPLGRLFPKTLDIKDDAANLEWAAVLDRQPTETNESTMYKTSDRSQYGRARADAGIFSPIASVEVLMFNSELQIIDCTSSTPYFFRNGKWVTPMSSAGGLQGTTRRWALEKGLCSEAAVLTTSMVEGEIIWLSNAVRGFFPAVYRARDPNLKPASAHQSRMVEMQLGQP